MEIFLLRHGQSEFNIGLTDNLDSPLTELGRQQAVHAADRLLPEGIGAVYVSPLLRTLQTIKPFCTISGLTAEVVSDACEYFSSAHYQNFPGMSLETIQHEFPFAAIGDMFPCSPVWWPQQIETDAVIYARAERVRDTIWNKFGASDTHILIVSHAETVGRLIEAFLRVPPRPDTPPWSDNCGVTMLTCPVDPTQPAILVYQNDINYLGALRS